MAKKKKLKYRKPAAASLQSFIPKVVPDKKTKYKRKPRINNEDQ